MLFHTYHFRVPGSSMLIVTPTSRLLIFHLYASCFLLSYHVPHHVVLVGAAASPFSFSFDFSSLSKYRADDLQFEVDASVHGGLVDLTANSSSNGVGVGAMSYKHPVPFYDRTTGQVASFATQFSFAIRLVNDSGATGDGMAFFLSSYPSRLPLTPAGGDLGLRDVVPGGGGLVAVEFDTYANNWDPCGIYDHMAIDINTAKNSTNETCFSSFNLTGSMTASVTFNSTTRMLVASLHFDDNPSRGSYQVSTQLTDPVTALLSTEVAVGFSATSSFFELHQIISWTFNSTLARKDNRKLVIGGAIASAAVVVGIIFIWSILSWFRWRRTRDSFSLGTTGLKRFEYSVLGHATGRFSKDNELGAGAFGKVYKGSYTDENGKQDIAVKKIKHTTGDVRDFVAELTINGTSHVNLVVLKGWCCSRNRWNLIDFMCWCRKQRIKLFIVYQLVPNGSLDDHLHHREKILPWEKRYHIVKGIGSALRYLHHEHSEPILHRDIKPGNILLDNDFNAKLADFGLSRITGEINTKLMTYAIGTMGYMDPQCMKDGKVQFSRKSDIYSFGIVLLEIACTDKSRQQVRELYMHSGAEHDVMKDVADPKLCGVFDRMEMERVIVLGLRCFHRESEQRPYMVDAMKFLEDGVELPDLTEIEDRQGSKFIDITSDEHAFLPPELRS